MHFRDGDHLLSAAVITDRGYVFVVTEGGFAKRTAVEQYRLQNRGGIGIKVAKLEERRGDIVGALIVEEDDEVLIVLSRGKVVRSAVSEVPARGRDTMGVVFARFDEDDSVLGLAKNSERNLDGAEPETSAVEVVPQDETGE
jgi:DNA gyrase subunit A